MVEVFAKRNPGFWLCQLTKAWQQRFQCFLATMCLDGISIFLSFTWNSFNCVFACFVSLVKNVKTEIPEKKNWWQVFEMPLNCIILAQNHPFSHLPVTIVWFQLRSHSFSSHIIFESSHQHRNCLPRCKNVQLNHPSPHFTLHHIL